ncbi:hypothetical protein [Rhizobium sp. NFR03]|uniref:hypothetical protein n=1 Tax=Rhizobium sp. NFR03 TaxID=1566263 RepID=UPI0008B50232|nr:hypothetical protein [Rhizobium sp. NFR03]SER57080.1 hypothetical protein SAMN03159406_00514 [Rhizobium sp. NFR03]
MRKLLKIVTYPIRAVIFVGTLIEFLVRPVYGPLVKAVMGLQLFAAMERRIGTLPRLAILVLFVVPFAIAEPMKIAAVVIIAKGQLALGMTTLILSYLATFLIVERIYHAGHDKLLTYKWFAWSMKYVRIARAYFDMAIAVSMRQARSVQAWLFEKTR